MEYDQPAAYITIGLNLRVELNCFSKARNDKSRKREWAAITAHLIESDPWAELTNHLFTPASSIAATNAA